MIELRPYQADLVGRIRDAFRQGWRRLLLVSPTGSGKTVMFNFIAERTAHRGKRVGIVVHRHRRGLPRERGGGPGRVGAIPGAAAQALCRCPRP